MRSASCMIDVTYPIISLARSTEVNVTMPSAKVSESVSKTSILELRNWSETETRGRRSSRFRCVRWMQTRLERGSAFQ
jgi:hypothetical protein